MKQKKSKLVQIYYWIGDLFYVIDLMARSLNTTLIWIIAFALFGIQGQTPDIIIIAVMLSGLYKMVNSPLRAGRMEKSK